MYFNTHDQPKPDPSSAWKPPSESQRVFAEYEFEASTIDNLRAIIGDFRDQWNDGGEDFWMPWGKALERALDEYIRLSAQVTRLRRQLGEL